MELVLIFLVTVNALILLAMAWLGLYPIIEPMLPRRLKNMFSFFARHAVWMFSLLAVGGVGTIIAIGVLTYKVNQKADEKMENVQNTLNSIAQKLYPDLPLSEALEKLKKLETRTSTLEQKTAPRSLTPEQRTQLITRLSPYKGQNIVIHL